VYMSRTKHSVASQVWETLFYKIHLDNSLIGNFPDIHIWEDFGIYFVDCNEIRIFLDFWKVKNFYY
jgi:hypothetical protein